MSKNAHTAQNGGVVQLVFSEKTPKEIKSIKVSENKGQEDIACLRAQLFLHQHYPELPFYNSENHIGSIQDLCAHGDGIYVLREYRDKFYEIIPKEFRDFNLKANQTDAIKVLRKRKQYIDCPQFKAYVENKQFAKQYPFRIDMVFVVVKDGKVFRQLALETSGPEHFGPIRSGLEGDRKYYDIVMSDTMKAKSGVKTVSHVERRNYKRRLGACFKANLAP